MLMSLLFTTSQTSFNHLSLKLASGDDMEVSVVRFMDESEAEMSEVRVDLKEVDKSEVEEVESDGDIGGSAAYSAK